MSNEFFARWSRRKLEEATPEPAETAAPPPVAEDPAAPSASESAVLIDTITEEELAALPDPDAVTTWADITGFLRQGVPLALRNRALRRMWSLDPSIRDYVGDARDYAWDWNTPGGMPVSGPLSASTDVGKILRGLYEPAPETPVRETGSLPEHEELIEPAPDRRTGERTAPQPDDELPKSAAETPEEQDDVPVARATRHGGALPS